jgi:hypothetical protein
VIKGYDVVKKIESVKTGRFDKPIKNQEIIKAKMKESKVTKNKTTQKQ